MKSEVVRQEPGCQPTARRPIAEIFRGTARGATRSCLRLGISADAISYFSIAAAAGAAVCFWQSGRHPWLLIVAPLLCGLRLWCNMLDGMVALACGKASWRGEILNDLRHNQDVQFQRLAQLQAEMDLIARAWEKLQRRVS